MWAAHVHAAQQGDGSACLTLVSSILYLSERIEKIYGDQAYNGVFAKEITNWGFSFEKASRAESTQGFVPIAKRWVVERSIAWTNFFRRLVKDYEYTVSSARRLGSVAWLYLANIQMMLQRIPISYQT